MSPNKYQPDSRLIDDPEELRRLYQEDGLSIREIAKEHASVSKTRVYQALNEHGIDGDGTDEISSNPTSASREPREPDWSQCTD